MRGPWTVAFVAALLVIGTYGHGAEALETKAEQRDKQLGLTEEVQVGGRRALLNVGGRDKFLRQSYVEAIESMLREHEKEAGVMGRRLLQVTNPVQRCGLVPLITQAQTSGVSFEAIANLFLEILLLDLANTPSGFSLFQGSLFQANGRANLNAQAVVCNLARVRLQALIQASATGTLG